MRLPTLASIGLAAFGAAALSGPVLAHGSHMHHEPMPPMAMDHGDMPPPVDDGSDGAMPHPDYRDGYGPWHHPDGPMPGPWMGHCAEHAQPAGCAPYPHAYPMMSYAVPMMMVPVLRQKPCPEEEVVEEWIEEEPVPVRRRTIAPRPVKEKRVKIAPEPDKRVPDKRIPY